MPQSVNKLKKKEVIFIYKYMRKFSMKSYSTFN